jgi:eukaryotic-like serine/threonine-protein kinase
MRKRIGKYRIERELGRGGSSTVYLAFDDFSKSDVAVKVYQGGLPDDESLFTRKQFLSEASLVGQLQHPHIAGILDAYADQDVSYVAMEYVPGGNLLPHTNASVLLPVADVIEIAFKASGALDYAFRQGIVHRDIKPANMLLDHGTEVKLVDFGAAFLRNSDRTQIMIVGSPSYASPEQRAGKTLTHRSDMFSLGVVLYELLTGQRPFSAPTPGEAPMRVLRQPPPPPSALQPDLPGTLDDIVLRALAIDPADRYDSWAELALDLARAGQLSPSQKGIPDSERFTALRRAPLLAELDDAEIWALARAARWSRVPSQKVIVREDDTGDSLFLLAEGEAKVTTQGRLLNVLHAGESFGELPYILGQAGVRQASVETSTDSTLAEFERSALESLPDGCQLHFARALLGALAERISLSNARISRMTGG